MRCISELPPGFKLSVSQLQDRHANHYTTAAYTTQHEEWTHISFLREYGIILRIFAIELFANIINAHLFIIYLYSMSLDTTNAEP